MSRKLQAAAGIAGPVWFATLVVLQGLLNPDYDHVRLPISALAAWPSGWIQNLNFFVSGALMIAFAVGLHHGIRAGQGGGTGIALMLVGAAGIILAGVFPWIMVNGVPTETPPHVVSAVLTFLGAGLGLLALSRRLRADPR